MPDPTPCPKCGQVHARCTAHKRNGTPCTQRAMTGQRTCRMHGGASPKALEAAKRRTATADALQALREYGAAGDGDVDPATAVMDVLRRTHLNVAWLGLQVQALPALTTRNYATGVDQPHVLVELYERERDRVGRLGKDAHSMGIAEQRVRLEERNGELMAAGVMWLLARLGVDDERGRGLAAEMFSALAQGALPAAQEA